LTRVLFAVAVAALAARAENLRDDPAGRARARALTDGPRTPEAQLQILRAARQLAQAPLASAAVPGSAWVNLGPTSADFDNNGIVYHSVDSGRARKILIDPRDPNVVYLATSGGGVWKTFNALATIDATGGGPTWQPITEGVGSLAVGSLAMDPSNPDILLLGLGDPFDVKSPGFLRSADGGATWSDPILLSDGAGGPVATSVRDIAIDPADSSAVLVATDVGLFRSTDGGATFTLIVLDPAQPQEAWSIGFVGGQTWLATSIDLNPDGTACTAGPGCTGKLWRSTDGGASFVPITVPDFGSPPDVARMTLATSFSDRATPSTAFVYLVANNNTASPDQKDVFKSTDGGATWPLGRSALGLGPGKLPINRTLSPPDPPDEDQPDTDVLHDQAWYNQLLLVDPTDHRVLFLGGNLSLLHSRDAGVSWDVVSNWLPEGLNSPWPSTSYVHADLHAGAIAHVAGVSYVYAGSDGGLFRSTSDFVTQSPGSKAVWENRINRGIVTHLIYSVVTGGERASTGSCPRAAGAEDLILGGFQDNGTRLRASGSPTVFNQIQGGDGFGVGMGCATGGTIGSLLLSTYASQISASTDGGKTFSVAMNGITIQLDPNYTFVMRIAADLTDPRGQTFLTPLTDTALKGYVFRTTNGAASWANLNGTIHLTSGGTASLFPKPVRDAQADPSHAGHYAAVDTASAYVSVDAGANWAQTIPLGKDPGGDYVHPHTIGFDPSDTTGNTLWAGSRSVLTALTASPVGCHLFKSTNARAGAGSTWINRCTSGLPNVPVNVVKVDPGNTNTVYVGTEIGLFRSQNGGDSWSLYGAGLPLVSVTDLAISASEGSVRVATFGRGFWEISNTAGGSAAGVAGNGDFDRDQVIDGTDLVREAALLLTDSTADSYDPIGNLTGATNAIDAADLTALLGKFGSRP
jgi:hypothetical protein